MSQITYRQTRWRCDKCGTEVVGPLMPRGWDAVPVLFGPETHHIDHHCGTCREPAEPSTPTTSEAP